MIVLGPAVFPDPGMGLGIGLVQEGIGLEALTGDVHDFLALVLVAKSEEGLVVLVLGFLVQQNGVEPIGSLCLRNPCADSELLFVLVISNNRRWGLGIPSWSVWFLVSYS